MGDEALSLEEGSTGASQTQLLALRPLRAEPLPLKVLQHLPPVAFNRLLQCPGSLSRFEGWARKA